MKSRCYGTPGAFLTFIKIPPMPGVAEGWATPRGLLTDPFLIVSSCTWMHHTHCSMNLLKRDHRLM